MAGKVATRRRPKAEEGTNGKLVAGAVPEPVAAAPSVVEEIQAQPSSPRNTVFSRASKRQARLRLAIDGPAGSGKTYSALAIGSALGQKIALIDTEHGSASKYADDPFTFDGMTLDSFEPQRYVDAIKAAEAEGYEVVIIDSLSHAWSGKGGALEQVDIRAGARGNKYAAWREVTPMHNALVEAILGSGLHVIATMRSKMEYALDQDGGKTTVRKLGMAPVQRDGIEYEFDVVGDLDLAHNLHITKTRCRALDGVILPKPGADLAEALKAWLNHGAPQLPRVEVKAAVAAPPAAPKPPANPETVLYRQIAVALGNTLDPKWPGKRYGEAMEALGVWPLVVGALVLLHDRQHGSCAHVSAIPASLGYAYPDEDRMAYVTVWGKELVIDPARNSGPASVAGGAPADAAGDEDVPF